MRFMRVIVFFDLPVKSKKDRKAYTDFRRQLMKTGFQMMQYSVYSRTVKNNDDAEKYCKLVEAAVPANGAVRMMTVTEKQYASIRILAGERMKNENLLDTKDILDL